MISSWRTALAAATVCLMPAAPVLAQNGPEGTWLMQNGKAEVQISTCGDTICGKVSRILKYAKDGARTDIHNGDASLRSRPLVGLPVLYDFKRGGGSMDGRVYDPKSGRSYRATLTQPNANRLSIKACLLFICKTQEWTRVR